MNIAKNQMNIAKNHLIPDVYRMDFHEIRLIPAVYRMNIGKIRLIILICQPENAVCAIFFLTCGLKLSYFVSYRQKNQFDYHVFSYARMMYSPSERDS